jgi:phenylpyruvate tautomerase
MPCLSIQTNRTLRDEQQTELLNKALEIVASQLGKPQRYVMVSLAPPAHINFAGDQSPTAYVELRSVGIPDSKRNSLCTEITDLIARSCEIKPDRIYIVLVDVNAKFWSLNGSTFG